MWSEFNGSDGDESTSSRPSLVALVLIFNEGCWVGYSLFGSIGQSTEEMCSIIYANGRDMLQPLSQPEHFVSLPPLSFLLSAIPLQDFSVFRPFCFARWKDMFELCVWGSPSLLNDLPLLNEKTVVEHKQKVLLNDALILHTHWRNQLFLYVRSSTT